MTQQIQRPAALPANERLATPTDTRPQQASPAPARRGHPAWYSIGVAMASAASVGSVVTLVLVR